MQNSSVQIGYRDSRRWYHCNWSGFYKFWINMLKKNTSRTKYYLYAFVKILLFFSQLIYDSFIILDIKDNFKVKSNSRASISAHPNEDDKVMTQ